MQTIPIFVALGAILFFEQKVRLKSWLMILCGLAGVVLIIKPGTEHFDKFSILMEFSKSENSLDVCRLCAITIRHACSSALSTNAPEGIIAS